MSRLADPFPRRDAVKRLDSAPKRLARLKSRRKLWLEVHLWLGLIAGALLVLIGLTGSVLVFWQEIDGWLNADLLKVEAPAGAKPLSLEALGRAAGAALPEGVKTGWIEFPKEVDQALNIAYEKPTTGQGSAETDTWNLLIDPYTGAVKGARIWYPASFFSPMPLMAFFFKLHYALLWKDYGVEFVGVVGVFLVFSALTGLIVWWPLTGRVWQALTIKRGASVERLNFDLHKTAGFYTSLVLLAVLVSGVYMNLPDFFTRMVEFFSPVMAPVRVHSKAPTGGVPIDWTQAAAKADQAYPEGRLAWLSSPDGPAGVFEVCKAGIPSLGRFVDNRCLLLDQYSGEVLKVTDSEQGSGGEVFLQWQWPLHSGQAFGWTGRILVFLAGLACALLYVTGFIRWRQKRRAKRPARA